MNTAMSQPAISSGPVPAAAPFTPPDGERLIGPSLYGPRCCLRCGRPFQPGQSWRRYASPADESGTYRVGMHDQCPLHVDGGG